MGEVAEHRAEEAEVGEARARSQEVGARREDGAELPEGVEVDALHVVPGLP